MKTCFFPVGLLSVLFPALALSEGLELRWLVVLQDESRIMIKPGASALHLESGAITGVDIQTAEQGKDGNWKVLLWNGDRFNGKSGAKPIVGHSAKGKVELSPSNIRRIEVVIGDGALEMPSPSPIAEVSHSTLSKPKAPTLPRISFGGFDWDIWRTGWETPDGERLASSRSVRPGFAYGHWANGRGGMAIAGNGDENWTDYEVAFDYKMLLANREFFHAHIPGESRGMLLFFRAKSLSESWNQPDTGYVIALNPSGTWTLIGYDGWHMPGNGWSSSNRKGTLAKLATGKAETLSDASEARIRILVQGSRFQAWLENEQLFDFIHSGGEIEPITYGGIGIQWRYESMGWIKNLEVRKLK